MGLELIANNILNPPILFFFMGLLAVWIGSDLEIPQPIPKILSLYLLFSIGFKGGVELSHSGVSSEMLLNMGLAILMSLIVPIYSFYVWKRKVSIYDAGALAATYGSISAVTFITATSYLMDQGIAYSGYMIAAMALMESPAIIVGVILINWYMPQNNREGSIKGVMREALTNSSVVMILGSLLIGLISSEKAAAGVTPFTENIFKGVLSFFLLDMGLLAAKRMKGVGRIPREVIFYGVLFPLINALIGILLTYLFDIPPGDGLLLTVLFASASYIAVPAAMRMIVPEANPGLYVSLSLAITFPLNVIIGIPTYFYLIQKISSL